MRSLIPAGSALAILGLVQGCAPTQELYAEYDEDGCRCSRTAIIQAPVSAVAVQTAPIPVPQAIQTIIWEPAVYFEFDQDYLIDREYQRLALDMQTLVQNPELRVVVRGFTDAFGTVEYNTDLAQRRVNTVYDYFIGQGIPAQRLVKAPVGESLHLHDPNRTANERGINRRVELLLVDANNTPYRFEFVRADQARDAAKEGVEGQRYLRDVDEVQGTVPDHLGTAPKGSLYIETQQNRRWGKQRKE